MKQPEVREHWERLAKSHGIALAATTKTSTIKRLEVAAAFKSDNTLAQTTTAPAGAQELGGVAVDGGVHVMPGHVGHCSFARASAIHSCTFFACTPAFTVISMGVSASGVMAVKSLTGSKLSLGCTATLVVKDAEWIMML